MLFALRDYIKQEQAVSIEQISRKFQLELSAADAMLEALVGRGFIKKISTFTTCTTSCQGCAEPGKNTYYQII